MACRLVTLVSCFAALVLFCQMTLQPGVCADTSLVLAGDHFTVHASPELRAYGESCIAILEAAWKSYRSVLGLTLPARIRVDLVLDSGGGTRCWTDGRSRISLNVDRVDDLRPPQLGGPHNVYALCHELGHLAFYHRLRNLVGLSAATTEGWAVHLGCRVTDAVFDCLGPRAWPIAHDYKESSGMPRLLRELRGPLDADLRGAKMLLDVELRHGTRTLGQAIDRALAVCPAASELPSEMGRQLARLTGDRSAWNSFLPVVAPGEMSYQPSREEVLRAREYGAQREESSGREIQLINDDGHRSRFAGFARSGAAAVCFRCPPGDWDLVGIGVYGWVSTEQRDAQLLVSVHDDEFRVLKTHRVTVREFLEKDGGSQWTRLALPPTPLPRQFAAGVSAASMGEVVLGIGVDGKPARGLSFTLDPEFEITKESDRNYMIRCILLPRR